MTRKRSKFFTFIFSILFGAGQMYMGFMKQGISIMTVTAVIIAFGSWTGIGMVYFVLPVLWFYSFFDSINKMTMPDSVFQTLEDHYIFLPSRDNAQLKFLIRKYERAIAIILILIGGSVLLENLLDFIAEQASRADYTELARFINSLRWNGSRILFSLIIIIIGIKMILGKKKELDLEEKELTKKGLNFNETGMKKDGSDNKDTLIRENDLINEESEINEKVAGNSETLLNKNELTHEVTAVHPSSINNSRSIIGEEKTDENA